MFITSENEERNEDETGEERDGQRKGRVRRQRHCHWSHRYKNTRKSSRRMLIYLTEE